MDIQFCVYIQLLKLNCLNRYGPLVRHWTMRFEARHLYFKKLAGRLGNFKNVPYSLAIRYQQLQCYVNVNDSTFADVLDFGQ